MKLSKLFFLVVLAIATVSCSSDDDGTPFLLNPANLSGNYKTELLTMTIEQTFTVNNVPVVSTTSIVGDTFELNTVFKEDGTYTSLGQYRMVTTTKTAGQTTTESKIVNVDETGTYVINQTAKNITITIDGESKTYNATLFNETKLNLQRDSSEPIDDVPTISSFKTNLVRK